ncbi:hypothetical protein BJF85_00245 [Saccharomonospora sp. CUA-673]|uniref:DUF6907 domain-containing protein n=1 Tax=Saccharomonospora sp. CUA-673 TaxID=1904969 RepID=UPI0009649D25|nr:hypothetical protein [Saccharomonospora sp. CUA-673]OLT46939.1 hypothetical protein BJF85_00245 [Saccharomonospora sp. CUA-673]
MHNATYTELRQRLESTRAVVEDSLDQLGQLAADSDVSTAGACDKPASVWTDGLVCPSWCSVTHRASDGGPDRVHYNFPAEVPLMLPDANVWRFDDGTVVEQPVLQVSTAQHVREVEPRVQVEPDITRADLPQLQLTLAEAAALGRALLDAVAQSGVEGDATSARPA